MDYLLDRYLFPYIPFDISDEWKHSISSAGMTTIKVADWFCKTQDLSAFYANHTSFLAVEIIYPILCILTLIHAYRHSARYFYTWVSIGILSWAVEILCSVYPNFNYKWHAQGLLTFMGGRIPLYKIFGIYQFTYYTAYIFVLRMHLPFWVRGPATGVGVLLLKIPFQIIGSKLLWWTWHINDPIFADKIYGVPWTEIVIDLTSASAFVIGLELSRKNVLNDYYDWRKEMICAIIGAMSALFFGILQITLLVIISQIANIPLNLASIAVISMSLIMVYIADRHNRNPEAKSGNPYWFDELSLAVCIHYIFIMLLILIVTPQNIVSQGMHQPIGPCNVRSKMPLILGKTIEKSTYLCSREIGANSQFDFHCIPGNKPPYSEDNILEWYPICGSPMNSGQYAEYITLIWFLCIFASIIMHQAAANSGKTPRIFSIIYRSPVIGASKKTK